MDTRRFEEAARWLGTIRWSAIATGVFIALALQTVLLLLGVALARSVGDEAIGGGFALWAVIVQLACLAVGAAIAAALSHVHDRMSGVAAGVMTWAVALVLGGVLSGFSLTQRLEGTAAWSGFFGALLGLAAAVVGGAFGATLRTGVPRERIEPLAPAASPPAPVGTL